MNECPICGGQLQDELVEEWEKVGEQWVLFRHVPAWVCEDCGDTSFSQETVELLADLADQAHHELATGWEYRPIFDLLIVEARRIARAQPRPSEPKSEVDVQHDPGTTQTEVSVFPYSTVIY